MKLLKIENKQGYYLVDGEEYAPVDQITKDDLLKLVDLVLNGDIEFDDYSDEEVKNQAHQVIYKSIFEKLKGLEERKDEIRDVSNRLYLQEYERYQGESS